jgi:glycine/D-amino acid oxidase-like deaminating enzyme
MCLGLQAIYKLSHSGEHLSGLKLPGNNLYPLKLVTRIFLLAQKQAADAGIDVSLFTYTPVHSVSASAKDFSSWALSTGRGVISTRQVVHATNAHASYLLPQFATGSQKIVPCRNQVIAVRPEQKENFWTTGFCKLRSLRAIGQNSCTGFTRFLPSSPFP